MIPVDQLNQYTVDNILTMDDSIPLIKQLKCEGKTVGLCHGGFDLVHPGHVKHFESAKQTCDVLFVSITADCFVASRKGDGRPVYTDKLRAYMVANMKSVDYVVITDFKNAVDIIKTLQPSFYIKGPDFINKSTPGITAERTAILEIGGEMKYTTEPPMSTTDIIKYIQEMVASKKILIIIDRDGTLIENDNFLGKNPDWIHELKLNESVVSYLSYLQTKYNTTKIVVTNQTGVARGYFTCEIVENINEYIHTLLQKKGIRIDNWQYCPDADVRYAHSHTDLHFDHKYVKEQTKRKPGTAMVDDALYFLKKTLKDFDDILIIGNGVDDKLLAENMKAKYIDVTGKCYEILIRESS
jgi:rfaE bifunctional protein nucleotidyltransferase chain/domain